MSLLCGDSQTCHVKPRAPAGGQVWILGRKNEKTYSTLRPQIKLAYGVDDLRYILGKGKRCTSSLNVQTGHGAHNSLIFRAHRE
jgi:hypothetical protein